MRKSIGPFIFFYLLPAFLCGILFFAPADVCASSWGLLRDLEKKETQTDTPIYKFYAMNFYLTNRPITYAFSIDYGEKTPPDTLTKELHRATLMKKVEKNFQQWLTETEKMIRTTHREADFADVLKILSTHKLKLKPVKQGKPDITFLFSIYPGGGLYNKDTDYGIRIPNPFYSEEPEYQKTDYLLTHEFGHFWGLSDRYFEGANNSSVEYSTSGDINSKAIMSDGKDFTCDDIDGFINVMDWHIAQIKGQFPKRAQQGWKGFCENRYYKNAREINRKEHFLGLKTISFNSDGSVKESKEASLPNFLFGDSKLLSVDLEGVQRVPLAKSGYVEVDFTQLRNNYRVKIKGGTADFVALESTAQYDGNAWAVDTSHFTWGNAYQEILKIENNRCVYRKLNGVFQNSQIIFSDSYTQVKAEGDFTLRKAPNDPFHLTWSENKKTNEHEIGVRNSRVDYRFTNTQDILNHEGLSRYQPLSIHQRVSSLQTEISRAEQTCRFFERLQYSLL